MHEPIRVLVVDAFPVVRAGLLALLEPETGIEVVAESGDIEATLRLCRQQRPDVLLLGLVTPDPAALVLLRRLKRKCPDTKVLVLATACDEACAAAVLAAGASGCLLKAETQLGLVRAIHAVLRGETPLSRPVVSALVQAATSKPTSALTKRQLTVLQHVAGGQTNEEIAQSLGISKSTVRYHLSNLYRRLSVSSRAEAVAEAMRQNLL